MSLAQHRIVARPSARGVTYAFIRALLPSDGDGFYALRRERASNSRSPCHPPCCWGRVRDSDVLKPLVTRSITTTLSNVASDILLTMYVYSYGRPTKTIAGAVFSTAKPLPSFVPLGKRRYIGRGCGGDTCVGGGVFFHGCRHAQPVINTRQPSTEMICRKFVFILFWPCLQKRITKLVAACNILLGTSLSPRLFYNNPINAQRFFPEPDESPGIDGILLSSRPQSVFHLAVSIYAQAHRHP